jgi:alanine dehydrogenase
MIANEIGNEVFGEIINKAPIIIHQRFCAKLVEVMKANPTKTPSEVPKAMEVISAINILEELYPELNTDEGGK